MSSDRVLVIGGSRGTGLLIARRLAQAGSAVRALARDPARATEAIGRMVEIVAGEITCAARAVGLRGRFLYRTAIGGGTSSLASAFLNRFKGNTLRWRERAEGEIRYPLASTTRSSGAGCWSTRPRASMSIELSQTRRPLSLRYRIARADVAEGFVAALEHPRASRATFEIVWGHRGPPEPWPRMLDRLRPDASR